MGGGERKVKETPKRLRPRRTNDTAIDGSGGGSGGGQVPDLDVSICEREQAISFRVAGKIEAGSQLRVQRGQPPVIVVDGRVVGRISNARQAATLSACMNEGYAIVGELIAVDMELGEGLATVFGVRTF